MTSNLSRASLKRIHNREPSYVTTHASLDAFFAAKWNYLILKNVVSGIL